MSRTIAELKTKIGGQIRGTTLNKINDFYGICEDAQELLLAKIKPKEVIRKTSITNAIYDRVTDYELPSDFKAIKDLRPQVEKNNIANPTPNKTFSKEFNLRKKDNTLSIEWENGTKFLRFNKVLSTPITIDKADSLTENGTWAVGGNASGLELDELNYIAGVGSLKASVSSSGAVVNLILRIGSDSSNYYEKTITTGHFMAFSNGFNLCRFNLNGATQTGTVDMTNISYIRVTTTYNTNQTAYFEKTLTSSVDLSGNYVTDGAIFLSFYFDSITSLTTIRLDNILAGIGTLFDLWYYSNNLFRNSAGTWIHRPTSDSDTIMLSDESYKIFEAEVMRIMTQRIQGVFGSFDFAYYTKMLDTPEKGLYDIYTDEFPSEEIISQTSYYNYSDDYGDESNNGTPLSYYS